MRKRTDRREPKNHEAQKSSRHMHLSGAGGAAYQPHTTCLPHATYPTHQTHPTHLAYL